MSTLEAAFNAAKRALSFTPLRLGAIARDHDRSAHALPEDDPVVAVIRTSGIVEGAVLIAIGEEYLERLEYTSKTEGLLAAIQGTVDAIKAALAPLGTFKIDEVVEGELDDWPGPASEVVITSAPLTDHDEVVARIAFGLTYHAVKEGEEREGGDDGGRLVVPKAATASTAAPADAAVAPAPGRPGAVGGLGGGFGADGHAASGGLDAAVAQELALLADVQVEISAVLGRTVIPMHELLSWLPGSIVTLDRVAGTPADLCIGETVVASGDVVVVEENFGVRVSAVAMRGPSAPSVGVSRP
jgi:flagellar motor switch protein FliN/FliY